MPARGSPSQTVTSSTVSPYRIVHAERALGASRPRAISSVLPSISVVKVRVCAAVVNGYLDLSHLADEPVAGSPGDRPSAGARTFEILRGGGKILLMGNGGSAADAQHIAAELVGRFEKERRGLAAIALTTDTSILTAVANDFHFEQIFARQLEALARPGDLVIGLSTSGNSANVLEAFRVARSLGVKTIAMAGKDGGELARRADLALVVPSQHTARIQEVHITLGHILCAAVDDLLTSGPERK